MKGKKLFEDGKNAAQAATDSDDADVQRTASGGKVLKREVA